MLFSVAALVTGIGFFVRNFGARDSGARLANTLLSLLWWWTALFFLPSAPAADILLSVGWILLAFSAALLLRDFSSQLVRFFRGQISFRLGPKLSSELQEICRALRELSIRRTGALIVLERRRSLEKYFERGVPLDAAVQAGLLISVFHSSSPLHDGAVVIRKNRIRAARVILPLAVRPEIPLGLGTRHRSAIGITEKTDAVAVAVSEERGTISVAFKGALARAEDFKHLEILLDRALRGKNVL